jgi:hypothetical protein
MFFGGDPFEHFAQAHGGGGGRGGRRPAADVDTTKLYEVMGVRYVYLFVAQVWQTPRFSFFSSVFIVLYRSSSFYSIDPEVCG